MYKILKVIRVDNGFEIQVKHSKFKTKHWLTAEFKDDDLIFNWKKRPLDIGKSKDIITMLLQKSADEFCDASASALCHLEGNKFIEITDDFRILEVKQCA